MSLLFNKTETKSQNLAYAIVFSQQSNTQTAKQILSDYEDDDIEEHLNILLKDLKLYELVYQINNKITQKFPKKQYKLSLNTQQLEELIQNLKMNNENQLKQLKSIDEDKIKILKTFQLYYQLGKNFLRLNDTIQADQYLLKTIEYYQKYKKSLQLEANQKNQETKQKQKQINPFNIYIKCLFLLTNSALIKKGLQRGVAYLIEIESQIQNYQKHLQSTDIQLDLIQENLNVYQLIIKELKKANDSVFLSQDTETQESSDDSKMASKVSIIIMFALFTFLVLNALGTPLHIYNQYFQNQEHQNSEINLNSDM